MGTRITIAVATREGGGSESFVVADDFDTVMEAVMPTRNPSSALEARQNLVRRLPDGRRLWVAPSTIVWAEESPEDDA